jgi:hypothetical protein
MPHLSPGDTITPRVLTMIRAETVRVPDPQRLVHLQFRRYAGCPVCNLHLRAVARRHDDVIAAGIRAWPSSIHRPRTCGRTRATCRSPRLPTRTGGSTTSSASKRLVAARYGRHANDHWSVAELIELAQRDRTGSRD